MKMCSSLCVLTVLTVSIASCSTNLSTEKVDSGVPQAPRLHDGPYVHLEDSPTDSSGYYKPRLVVLTDISTWEPDDMESMIRLLVHADLFEIEGLVFTTGYSLDRTRDDFFMLIHDVIDAYEKDLPNLLKRSEQSGHTEDTGRQAIGYWPSPDYLRDRTMYGSRSRGYVHIGEGNDSDGSRLIIDLADEDDDRPVWITVWGGANTLAQAVWRVQQERSEEELKAFLHKLRVYTITDQDRTYDGSEGYEISSHQWLRREFAEDLFFIWDESAWKYQNSFGASQWSEYETHIQGHGNLGRIYPKYKYGVEGDTPAFLHLIPNGLNNPNNPGHTGWGGYFSWGLSPDGETYAFTNHRNDSAKISSKYQRRFNSATFNNFAARMDWAANGNGNRNPVIIINNDSGPDIFSATPTQGDKVIIDASKSYDPDGDTLTFSWWMMPEPGTYTGEIMIRNDETNTVTVIVPENSAGTEFHLICEVTDNGTHDLYSYRRIVFRPVE
ncbi:MAG: DUF1593 domain-containing protein [Spirochaetales bacterium]|nr:DUF1593 domain-containing protein [Spirochaetales bacterium]